MPSSDELLREELRAGFAVLAREAPSTADVEAARTSGERAQRLRRLAFAGPAALLLVVGAVTLGVLPHHGSTASTIGPSTSPAPSQPAELPSLGRVGAYVATYLPDTTVQPVRSDPLTFEGGRCEEVNGSASATTGCWSPAQCQANASITTSSPCNVNVSLEITPNDTLFRTLKAGGGSGSGPTGQTVTAVTINSHPGFLADIDHFFNQVVWRLPDGRFAQARGANVSSADLLAFAEGIAYRPSPDAPVETASPTPTPSPSIAVDAVDARPTLAPPAVGELHLPQGGSATAVAGNGWFLDISQGNSGPGAASVGIDDAGGHGRSSDFVITEVYGPGKKVTPLLLRGLIGTTVADFTSGDVHHVVAAGAVPRGTTGVGILDSSGHRGWAVLVDPGSAFDTLFFAYEPPGDAPITGMQSFGPSGPTGAKLPPFTNDPSETKPFTRAPGAPVVVGGLTVGSVPAGVTLGMDPCSPANETATQVCWAGKITDPAAARAAQQTYGVSDRLLDVEVDGGDHLGGVSGATTTLRSGVQVTEVDQGPAVLLSFRLSNGHRVFIRGINLGAPATLAVADSLIR